MMTQNNFDKRCYALLKRIPKGKVTTYKLLAEAVSVPCHRVVRSDGKVGGYAKGSEAKTVLLQGEGVTVTEGKVDPLEAFLFTF